MNKLFVNIMPRIMSILLILIFAISFIHSELGDCSLHEEHHASHDFCMMIKGANVTGTSVQQAKVLGFDITKELFVEVDYLNILTEAGKLCKESTLYQSPPFPDDIFKINMSFLI